MKSQRNISQWFNTLYSYQLTWILRVFSLLLGGKIKVELEQPLSESKRIIEIAATQVRFLNYCLNCDRNNYLGILRQDIPSPQTEQPDQYVLPVEESWRLKNNNAEVLLLSEAKDLHQLWYFGEYKHTKYIFSSPKSIWALVVSLPGLIKNSALGRVKVLGVASLETNRQVRYPALVVKITKRSLPNARRYISPVLGISNFFAGLNQQQIDYAILRWFDELPAIAPGEDIDMLVADADIEKLESLFEEYPGIIPCDVYSVTGLPGTAYKNMAYYPPLVAEQILKGKILIRDTFYVPNPEIHFESLAYHAIYHKGHKSGIPWSVGEQPPTQLIPEHEYQQILQDLARSLELEIPITLKDLDAFLQSIDWRPSTDTLARLDSSHLWHNDSNLQVESSLYQEIEGLAVFLLRNQAVELGMVEEIRRILHQEGFNLIETRVLDPNAQKRVKYQVRGGNWGKGPWAESGGDPVIIFVAVDLMPTQPTAKQLAKQPHLSNGRITIKNKIRDVVNRNLPPAKQCNTVHSSDNEREAWNYLEIALPQECDRLRQRIVKMRSQFATEQQIEQVLTRFGRRAKVEVIRYGDRLAVKKTFRPGCEKFCQREIYASQTFATETSTVPELLDWGADYLIYPYYQDTLRFQNRQSKLLPLKVAKQALQTLQFFYDRGYAVIDFQPANIIVDRQTGLKILDFEFLYQYTNKPQSFEKCYELAGLPDDFAGDKPDLKMAMSYETRWQPYVGLSLKSLLNDPVWLQQLKRLHYGVTHLPIRWLRNQVQSLLSQKQLIRFNSLLPRK